MSQKPLPQRDAHGMIRRRAAAAGIATRVGHHAFRATGITAYLKNGSVLTNAAAMAARAATRTTQRCLLNWRVIQPLIQVQSQNEPHHGCGLTLKRLLKLTSR